MVSAMMKTQVSNAFLAGWSDELLELFLREMSFCDSNNFIGKELM